MRLARALLLAACALALTPGVAAADEPPAVTIDAQPAAATRSTTATFRWTGGPGATSYACTVDGATTACESPLRVTVADGDHVFSVTAAGEAGTGPAASASWTVDSTPPAMPALPAMPARVRELVLDFSTAPGETYECRTDIGAYVPCTPPARLGPLPDGWHTYAVRGIDAVGPGPAAIGSTTVDATPPVARIAVPSDVESDATPTFGLSANESATFTCALDDGAPAACSSPWTAPALGSGAHTLALVATDAAGNIASTVTSGWTLRGPATPTPTPTPAAPSDEATPAPSPAAVTTPAAATPPPAARTPTPVAPVVSTGTGSVRAAPAPALLTPFPVVRIAGSVGARSTRISVLSVDAPRSATVTIRCRGASCPRRTATLRRTGAARARVRWLEGARLGAGTTLEVRILAPGRIGKYTRFAVRRGRPPARRDACTTTSRAAPVRCPAS